jgi:molecular chaperone Hsp33
MDFTEKDTLIRAITKDGFASLTVVSTREITERIAEIHAPSRTALAALGRTAAAVSIMGDALKKDGASVTAMLNGGGAIGQILAVADSSGNVRISVSRPQADLPLAPSGKLNVGGLVGTDGYLAVAKDFGTNEPYSGYVPLVSGEIGDDFAAYFAQSEQTGSAVGLGVLIGGDDRVIAAGGFVLTLLPSCPDPDLLATQLEQNLTAAGSVTDMLKIGGVNTIAERLLAGLSPRILETHPIRYECFCSRERTLKMLASLPKDDLISLNTGGKPLEVTCDFCDKVYTIALDEL